MEITITDNFPEYSASMARYFDELGFEAKEVVRKEAGIWCRSMSELSPPDNRTKSAKKIESRVGRVFEPTRIPQDTKKQGIGGEHWLFFDSDSIVGVDAEKDLRGMSSADLYHLLYAASVPKGVKKGQRGKQKVSIIQKLIVKQSEFRKLVKRVQGHLGRLKAAFLVGWQDCGSPFGSFHHSPPEWVMRHVPGARQLGLGYTIDALSTPGNPTITIVAKAKGVPEVITQGTMEAVSRIRVKAIAEDMRRRIRGEKGGD